MALLGEAASNYKTARHIYSCFIYFDYITKPNDMVSQMKVPQAMRLLHKRRALKGCFAHWEWDHKKLVRLSHTVRLPHADSKLHVIQISHKMRLPFLMLWPHIKFLCYATVTHIITPFWYLTLCKDGSAGMSAMPATILMSVKIYSIFQRIEIWTIQGDFCTKNP